MRLTEDEKRRFRRHLEQMIFMCEQKQYGAAIKSMGALLLTLDGTSKKYASARILLVEAMAFTGQAGFHTGLRRQALIDDAGIELRQFLAEIDTVGLGLSDLPSI